MCFCAIMEGTFVTASSTTTTTTTTTTNTAAASVTTITIGFGEALEASLQAGRREKSTSYRCWLL
jgi:hypothetical protein